MVPDLESAATGTPSGDQTRWKGQNSEIEGVQGRRAPTLMQADADDVVFDEAYCDGIR